MIILCLKEIYEQPKSIINTLRGKLTLNIRRNKIMNQKGIQADQLIIIACGTSWHAALIGSI